MRGINNSTRGNAGVARQLYVARAAAARFAHK